MVDSYCNHCGRGNWNPETGVRCVRWFLDADETTHGVELKESGKVVIDVAWMRHANGYYNIRVRDPVAKPLAVELFDWLAQEYRVFMA